MGRRSTSAELRQPLIRDCLAGIEHLLALLAPLEQEAAPPAELEPLLAELRWLARDLQRVDSSNANP